MRHRFDKKSIILQLILLAMIGWAISLIAHNVQANLATRGVKLGFDFLNDTAGFGIIFHLIEYSAANHYWQVFWVGLFNTLLVAGIGIVLATLLGFIIGVGSVSKQPTIALLAKGYVEILRNIPLLLQLFFWYFVVLRSLPYPQESIGLGDFLFLNNRGFYIPKPIGSSLSMLLGTMLLVGFIFFISVVKLNKARPAIKGLLIGILSVLLILFFHSLTWEKPVLGKFNFNGGINLIPEFIALVFALSTYTAAYIAEIVRMGLQAVPKGQYEAARSLGFSRYQSLRLIIFPQALRIIAPPLTNQFLNLTKNSSLATAIAFPDLVSLFAGTVLNQTGHAIEIIFMTMSVYLVISLCLSSLMMLYERKLAWR